MPKEKAEAGQPAEGDQSETPIAEAPADAPQASEEPVAPVEEAPPTVGADGPAEQPAEGDPSAEGEGPPPVVGVQPPPPLNPAIQRPDAALNDALLRRFGLSLEQARSECPEACNSTELIQMLESKRSRLA